jgi:hypothetical protein
MSRTSQAPLALAEGAAARSMTEATASAAPKVPLRFATRILILYSTNTPPHSKYRSELERT